MPRGKKKDPLQIQIAVSVKVPKGTRVNKRALKEAIQAAADGEKLPPNVKIRGIWWRNPARRGTGAYWRYNREADNRFAPKGAREAAPRNESLQDAFDTLYNFIVGGEFSI